MSKRFEMQIESCDAFRKYISHVFGNDLSAGHLEIVKALAVIWSKP